MEPQKIVCLFSGGADSATLITYYKKAGYDVYALGVNYGQKHNKELIFASNFCSISNIKYKIIDLTSLKELLSASVLTSDKPVPEEHYTHENQKQTVVPNRNMILLSIATGYAVTIGAKYIAFAAHANDFAIYPDCRPSFVNAFGEALTHALFEESKINVIAPFVHMTKGEIIKLGTELGVPYENTWSCYNGRDKACGKCGTCQERLEAFAFAGIKDPLKYE
jgi:7-cyano-7-deazaguanine synthase